MVVVVVVVGGDVYYHGKLTPDFSILLVGCADVTKVAHARAHVRVSFC